MGWGVTEKCALFGASRRGFASRTGNATDSESRDAPTPHAVIPGSTRDPGPQAGVFGLWVPAFAGMTDGGAGRLCGLGLRAGMFRARSADVERAPVGFPPTPFRNAA